MVVGTHEEDPSTQMATIRLWGWESGIPIPPAVIDMESPASAMNTTSTTDAIDPDVTTTTEGEQQQEQ